MRKHVQLPKGVHVLLEDDGTVQVIMLGYRPGVAPTQEKVEGLVGGPIELGEVVVMPDGVAMATGRKK